MAVRLNASTKRLLRTTGNPGTGSDFVIAFWLYRVSSITAGGTYCFVGDDHNGGTYLWLGEVNNQLRLAIGGDDAYYASLPAVGTWFHLAIRHEGSLGSGTRTRIYQDGIERIALPFEIFSSAPRWEFGAYASDNYDPSDIRVSAIKRWDALLSAKQIANEMQTVMPREFSGLYGWWPCLPGTAERSRDYSHNGNNFTEQDTLTDEDGPPIPWQAKRLWAVPSILQPQDHRNAIITLPQPASPATAIRFDDPDVDYVRQTANLFSYNLPYTVMFWGCISVDRDTYSHFFAVRNGTGFSNYDHIGTLDDGVRLRAEVSNSNEFATETGTILTVGKWYHIAGVRENDTTWKIYLNSALDMTVTSPNSVSTRPAPDALEMAIIESAGALNGKIAAAKLWTEALTPAQIRDEMYSVEPRFKRNVWEWWPMRSHEDLRGYSGNGHHWTGYGTLSTEAGPPLPRKLWFIPATYPKPPESHGVIVPPQPAPPASAIRFDRTSGKYLTRTTSLPSLAADYTLMLWMYPLALDALGYYNIFVFRSTMGAADAGQIYDGKLNAWANGNETNGPTALSVNRWYHIAYTRTSSAITGWIDGASEVSQGGTYTGRTETELMLATWDAIADWADARFSAIKIWAGVALTQVEIQREMYSPRPVRTANLNGWYPCLPGAGNRGRDHSGNGNHFTEYGALTDEAGPPLPRKVWFVPATYPPPPQLTGMLAFRRG